MSDRGANDVGLIVSELVTNSVRHAGAGAAEAVIIEVMVLGDRVRLAVVDRGSEHVPHIAPREADEPGGLGLRLVEQLATDWGVARDADGADARMV